jgi:hypothetical protein
MHFEVLVEDQSGKRMIDIILPKILRNSDTFKVHPYKGIGRIPRNLIASSDASKRILLDQLPRLLRGFGKTFLKYPNDSPAVVIVVCDLDRKCLKEFRAELYDLLDSCFPKPETRFCIAVEEGEAWLLGDIEAVKLAYPKAKKTSLNSYVNDSICNTWECLADAVYPGGSKELSKKGWQVIGKEKSIWAEKISPHIDINENKSPSFNYFVLKIRELLQKFREN